MTAECMLQSWCALSHSQVGKTFKGVPEIEEVQKGEVLR